MGNLVSDGSDLFNRSQQPLLHVLRATQSRARLLLSVIGEEQAWELGQVEIVDDTQWVRPRRPAAQGAGKSFALAIG